MATAIYAGMVEVKHMGKSILCYLLGILGFSCLGLIWFGVPISILSGWAGDDWRLAGKAFVSFGALGLLAGFLFGVIRGAFTWGKLSKIAIVHLTLMLLLIGGTALMMAIEAKKGSEAYQVQTLDKEVSIDQAMWKAMVNESQTAVNFERRTMDKGMEFPSVLTIFKVPITRDRKGTFELTDTETMDLFQAHPGVITVQLVFDRGRYWILLRESFRISEISNLPPPKGRLTDDQVRNLYLLDLQSRIDDARAYVLENFP